MIPFILVAFSARFPNPRPNEPLGPGAAPGAGSSGMEGRLLRGTHGRRTRESDSIVPPERIVLAATPRTSPITILRPPIEKRRKPEPRVKLETWCERTVPPIRHWKTPKGPNPNSGPATGKNLSKRCVNQDSSEKVRMVTWAMMNNQLMTAQAIPPVWFGTELFGGQRVCTDPTCRVC